MNPMRSPRLHAVLVALAIVSSPRAVNGQGAGDTTATLSVEVRADSAPVMSAIVRAGSVAAQTDASGRARLVLRRGVHQLITSRLGFVPDTVRLTLTGDTSISVHLQAVPAEMEAIVVSSTRAERRVEDSPIRVEVVDEEEVAEKVAMTPGDIVMMLNETSGLRVQTTSPSLGAAGVRIQGLRGRYSLLLADGLPLYGGQAGGLGLLQIPPVDLSRVEVIKGTASALYGPSALGGVINLVSRRPGDVFQGEGLVNQTSRGGSDAAVFLSSPLGSSGTPWGGTLLASGNLQRQNDLDGDAWADMPRYKRLVVRPRLFHEGDGRSVFATFGLTSENREGGTVSGGAAPGEAPDGRPFVERLRTNRLDGGVVGRWVIGGRDILGLRGSTVTQRHLHDFGPVSESDRHRTSFAEATATLPRGRWTHVVGAAVEEDRYRSTDVPAFNYAFRAPALFAQTDVDPAQWLAISGSARVDMHNEYGTSFSPRLSILLRGPADSRLQGWNSRLSVGMGTFAPIPFIEETEVAGLSVLSAFSDIRRERAVSGSFDINGAMHSELGQLEVTASLFASRLKDAVIARPRSDTIATGATRIDLVNAPIDARAAGFEILGRFVRAPVRVTATFAHLRSSEWSPGGSAGTERRQTALVPRNTAGVVASLEEEERFRVGLEVYYTGRQFLHDNPSRTASPAYVIVGLLGERWVSTPAGVARIFINFENLGDVRQTRYDPLLLPARGTGGRWTTDAWTELSGFTVNGGVRFRLPR
jgi:iron complex outermembrane receptor protein